MSQGAPDSRVAPRVSIRRSDEDVDWTYQTPLAAPGRQVEADARDLATISPMIAPRRDTPSEAPAPPRDRRWERAGYVTLVGGVGSLITAGVVFALTGLWLWLS